jgi:hypothetical protein
MMEMTTNLELQEFATDMNKLFGGIIGGVKPFDSFLRNCVLSFPEYYLKIGATLSGNYHPDWAQGKYGLARHTLVAEHIFIWLSETFELTPIQVKLGRIAVVLHDSFKYGYGKEPDQDLNSVHPLLPRSYFKEIQVEDGAMTPCDYDIIMRAVERHMGSFIQGKWGGSNGMIPKTDLEKAVHLADYMAAMRNMKIETKLWDDKYDSDI